MKKKNLLLFSYFLFISLCTSAQTDAYIGSWQMDYIPDDGSPAVTMDLQIGISEKNILYPAHLLVRCNNFSAKYELLLVRKNSRELSISKNKYAISESPFSLGQLPTYLNGIFDCSRDLKGTPTLTLMRLPLKITNLSLLDKIKSNNENKSIYLHLKSFFKDAPIKLKKTTSNLPSTENAGVTNPMYYFGVQDSLYIQQRDGILSLSGNKKTGTDIASISINGRPIMDQMELNKKTYTDDIFLDTGLNIITLFADNFGNDLPNKSKLNIDFGKRRTSLDFSNKADSAANFIVTKIYYSKDKEKEKSFQTYNWNEKGKSLQKNEKVVTSIISTSRELTLAIWDDAAEDGDSVSLNIDGKWIAQGFPVKKNPQFLKVTLKPGPNTITFIADNLGSIPPNTSVLEIIDGKKRKSFTIETTLGENNLIKILYDVSGN